MLSVAVIFVVRLVLVGLFLPFSALDKLLNFDAAVAQAKGTLASASLARMMIATGFLVEVLMSLAIITGVMDRLAAFILAGYCIVTALLWKRFWKTSDFRLKGSSQGRDIFWDFLKNFALAGGFMIVVTGGTAYGVTQFIEHPLASSEPYAALARQ